MRIEIDTDLLTIEARYELDRQIADHPFATAGEWTRALALVSLEDCLAVLAAQRSAREQGLTRAEQVREALDRR